MLLTSVGENGKNQPVEVKIVQILLNDWLGSTKQTLLKVDGIAGPLTIGAIRAFQKAQGIVTDGRADPTGRTIRGLVHFHLSSIRAALQSTAYGRQLLSTPMPKTPIITHAHPSQRSAELDFMEGLRALLVKQKQA